MFSSALNSRYETWVFQCQGQGCFPTSWIALSHVLSNTWTKWGLIFTQTPTVLNFMLFFRIIVSPSLLYPQSTLAYKDQFHSLEPFPMLSSLDVIYSVLVSSPLILLIILLSQKLPQLRLWLSGLLT